MGYYEIRNKKKLVSCCKESELLELQLTIVNKKNTAIKAEHWN